MSSPGFPSGSTFMPGSTEKSMQTIGNPSSGGSGSPNITGGNVAGASSAVMGALQMAVGFAQLRKAKRLPFPGYMAAKGPLAEMKSIYQNQMREGIGSEQRGIMRMRGAQTMNQQMNAVGQNAAQSSQLLGRTASLNRGANEARIVQLDTDVKQNAMTGVERMNNAMSALQQKDISAQRDYRIRAEQAAGAGIKRGSENIAGFMADNKTSQTG